MLESRAVIGDTDMMKVMQQDALRLAGKALDNFEAVDSTEIARFIKKVSPRCLLPSTKPWTITFSRAV